MDLFMLKHPTFGEEGNRKHNVPNVQKTNGYIYVPLCSVVVVYLYWGQRENRVDSKPLILCSG